MGDGELTHLLKEPDSVDILFLPAAILRRSAIFWNELEVGSHYGSKEGCPSCSGVPHCPCRISDCEPWFGERLDRLPPQVVRERLAAHPQHLLAALITLRLPCLRRPWLCL
jgi:hypothetical protein